MLADKKVGLVLKMSLLTLSVILLLMSIQPFLVASLGALTGEYATLKLWKEVFLAVLMGVLAVYLIKNKPFRQMFISNKLNQLILLYIVFNIVMAIITLQSGEVEAAFAGLVFNTRFLLVFLGFQLVYLLSVKNRNLFTEKLLTIFLYISIAVAVFGILQVTLLPKDFLVTFGYNGALAPPAYTTVDSNDHVLRAFSTMWGPNMLGSFLLLPLALFTMNLYKKQKMVFSIFGFSVSVLAIALTYSRSAFLAAVVVVLVVSLMCLKEKIKKHLVAIGALLVVGTIAISLLSTTPFVRLYVFHSSPGDTTIVEGSTNDHFVAIKENSQDVLNHPLGQGVGIAGPASFYLDNSDSKIAENYFVQLAQELGIIGLILFVAISVLVALKLFRESIKNKDSLFVALFASFIGINVINLFLHGWTDDPTSIVWWGFAALALLQILPKNPNS